MFTHIRVINGLIAFLAVLVVFTLFSEVGLSTAIMKIVAISFLVVVFFIADCIFRKSEEQNDLWFALAWTLFHSWTLYIGMSAPSTTSREAALIHSLVFAIFSGLPLLANSVYAIFLLKRRIATT